MDGSALLDSPNFQWSIHRYVAFVVQLATLKGGI